MRGSAARVLAFAGGNLLVAGAAVLLLRDLGVEDFGRYSTVIALLAIVQGVSDVGLSVTAMRELALLDDPSAQRALLARIVGARLTLTVLGVCAAVAFGAVAGYGSTLVLGTAVAGLGVVMTSTQLALVLPLSVGLRNAAVAVNEFVRQAVVALAIAVLVLVGAPLWAFFFAQVAAGVVGLAIVRLLLGRGGTVRPRLRGAQLGALLRIAAPVGIASVLSIVYFRILVVLVSLMTGARDTGLYVAASRIFELAVGLPLLLSVVAVPLLAVAARDDRARMQLVLQRMTEVMALAGVLAAVGLAAAARPIVLLVGGEEYAGAAPVLRILAVALVSLFVGAAWTPALVGLGRLRAVAAVSAVGLAVLVVLGITLTSAFGIRGAAVAVVTADLVVACGSLRALCHEGPGRALDLRFACRLSLVTASAVAVACAPGLSDAVGAAAAVAVLLALALALRLVPAEVLTAVRR